MSNRINFYLGIDLILTILIIVLISRCSRTFDKRGTSNYDGEVHKVMCISEYGDTVKVWETMDRPAIWESQGVICAHDFIDLETGQKVEVRTRTGTIVWQ